MLKENLEFLLVSELFGIVIVLVLLPAQLNPFYNLAGFFIGTAFFYVALKLTLDKMKKRW